MSKTPLRKGRSKKKALGEWREVPNRYFKYQTVRWERVLAPDCALTVLEVNPSGFFVGYLDINNRPALVTTRMRSVDAAQRAIEKKASAFLKKTLARLEES